MTNATPGEPRSDGKSLHDASDPTKDAATGAETPPEVIDPASFLGNTASPMASLDGAMPILLFVVINARFFVLDSAGNDRAWFAAAVFASVAWSIKTVIARRRQGLPTGRFIPIVTAWLVIKGLVGILTGNEDVFFGMSIGAKIAIGVALIGSVLIGRSFAGTAAPYVFGFSEAVQQHSSYISAMAHVTLVGALYEFISAGFDIWLLFIADASANQFVLIRYAVNWGASTIAIFGAMAYLGRRLQEIPGFPGVMAIFEAHVEATAERLGWDISEDSTR